MVATAPNALPFEARKRFVFVSSNRMWGGSEELWSATAARLVDAGHSATVFHRGLDPGDQRLQRLGELGCIVHDVGGLPLAPKGIGNWLAKLSPPAIEAQRRARLRMGLARSGGDLIVISQGTNHDGLADATACRKLKLPYVLIVQKATELYWPRDSTLERLRTVFQDALACYFVSDHNRRLTEEQLGIELPHATLVRNPFLVSWERSSDWPDDRERLRLACVGRIDPREKGQDLILRVLARERWRGRPMTVSFFGGGDHLHGLKAMAEYHRLANVAFHGFVKDVDSIWNAHHALLLASRCEGLPLALVEAMLRGRVPIVTGVAGNREVVEDDRTGFLAAAPTEDALDEAMERAWQRRNEWRSIGATAAESIRAIVPQDPAAVFAATLLRVAGAASVTRRTRAE